MAELGYDAHTSADWTTTSTSLVDTPLSVAIAAGNRPFLVIVRADLFNSTASLGAALYLNEDGTDIGLLCGILGTGIWVPAFGLRRFVKTPGTLHTYTIRAKNLNAGTLTVKAGAGSGTGNGPFSMEVAEV
jgi:hypothetical protein